MTNSMRILIVDDNPSIHDDIKHSLGIGLPHAKDTEMFKLEGDLFGENFSVKRVNDPGSMEFVIDSAYQGQEALEKVEMAEVEGFQYSIIIMDVRMPPGIDGIQTSARIWEKYPHIEIFICTAYSDYSWDQMLKDLGKTEQLLFIKKPFDRAEIKQLIISHGKKVKDLSEGRKFIRKLSSKVSRRSKQIKRLMEYLKNVKNEMVKQVIIKDHVVSNMSFELLSPLNGIMGMTSLLLDTELTEEQIRYTTALKESGDSLRLYINNMMDLLYTYEYHYSPEAFPFELRTNIFNIVEFIEFLARDREVDVYAMVDSGIPDFMVGDPNKLRQVQLSLFMYLLQAMNRGEAMIKMMCSIEGSRDQGGDTPFMLKIEVHCSGELNDEIMNENCLQECEKYQSYKGLEERNNPMFNLWLCKEHVKNIKGEIDCEKVKADKLVFSFLLPYQKSDLAPHDNDAEFRTIVGMKCLILSNSPINLKILSLFLEKWGARTMTASNISEAASKLSANRLTGGVDVIIADFVGEFHALFPELCQMVSKDTLNDNISLVAITSSPRKGDGQRFNDLGYDAYLSKPFKQHHLINSLRLIKNRGPRRKNDSHQILYKHTIDEVIPVKYRVLVVCEEERRQLRLFRWMAKANLTGDLFNKIDYDDFAAQLKRYQAVLVDSSVDITSISEYMERIKEACVNQPSPPIISFALDKEKADEKSLKNEGILVHVKDAFKESELTDTLRRYLESELV